MKYLKTVTMPVKFAGWEGRGPRTTQWAPVLQAGDVSHQPFRSLFVASTLAGPLKLQVSSTCPILSHMPERNPAVCGQSQVVLQTLPHT